MVPALAFMVGMALPFSAQQNFFFDLVTMEEKANFGFVNSLCQDESGIIWMGIFGKGLAFYDGVSHVRFPLDNEELFANSSSIFTYGDGIIYLNCKDHVQLFDPLGQQVVSTINGQRDHAFDKLVYYSDAQDTLLWAISYLEPRENRTQYRIFLSKNKQPFESIGESAYLTYGVPLILKYGRQVVLKDTNGIMILNQFGNTQQQYIPGLLTDQLTELNCYLDEKGNMWFGREYYCMPAEYPDIVDQLCSPKSLQSWNLETQRRTIYERRKPEMAKRARVVEKYPVDLTYAGGKIFIDVTQATAVGNTSVPQIFNLEDQTFSNYHGLILDKDNLGVIGEIGMSLHDKSGILWLGGKNGLLRISEPADGFVLLPSLGLRGFVETSDGYVVGHVRVYEPGAEGYSILSHYDRRTGEVTYSDLTNVGKKIPWQWMQVALLDDVIYAGCQKYDLDQGTVSWYIENDVVGGAATLVMLDRKDRLWRASWGSDKVGVYDRSTMELLRLEILTGLARNPAEINEIYQRPSTGDIWIGTYGQGLFMIPEEQSGITRLSRDTASPIRLPNNIVASFYEDRDRNMWIGHGSGLSRLSGDLEDISNFPVNPEFPELILVYAILPEDGDEALWLSTNLGIYRFDTRTESYMDFPLNPVIMHSEFNRNSALKTSWGQMFFGGAVLDDRTVAFYPQEVMDAYDGVEIPAAPLILHNIRKYDAGLRREVVYKNALQKVEEIVLNPGDRYFGLTFSITDFRRHADNHYSYYLEGYENDWNTPARNNNIVRYENLRPGIYTLKMRGALMHDRIAQNERHIRVVVLPFWYQTWWSKVLFGLALAGGLYLFFRMRLARQYEIQEAIRLRDLDNLKTRLYANITHEFRTPLTVIMGMNDNIEDHPLEKSLIRRNAESLLSLINQLLDLSKLNSGKLKVEPVQGDIISYLQYLAESFYSLASDKKISLSFRPEMDALVMDFDEVKMRHMIYNLLSNGIKFTRPGGKVVLEVSTSTQDNRPWVEIKVKDTGPGIPAKELPHIFDRFYQVEELKGDATQAQTTSVFAGTGIGLALTKELAELMGGRIEVKSTVGWGSEFTVLVPVRKEAQTPKMSTAPVPEFSENNMELEFESIPAAPDQIQGDKPLVLIIEDSTGVVTYIRSLLREDYHVLVAINGQEGIDIALEHIPDIVITDVMMPEKNGYEVCSILKHDERTSHIPIVMLTAKVDLHSKIAGLETGADVYLVKPFEKQELLVHLRNLLVLRKTLQQKYASMAAITTEVVTSDTPSPLIKPDIEDRFLRKLCDVIEANLSNADLSVPDVCKSINLSHTQLYRKIKALTGKTPSQFIRSIRLQKALHMLETTTLNISEVAYETGFNDPNYFSRMFRQEYGKAPGEMRSRGMMWPNSEKPTEKR